MNSPGCPDSPCLLSTRQPSPSLPVMLSFQITRAPEVELSAHSTAAWTLKPVWLQEILAMLYDFSLSSGLWSHVSGHTPALWFLQTPSVPILCPCPHFRENIKPPKSPWLPLVAPQSSPLTEVSASRYNLIYDVRSHFLPLASDILLAISDFLWTQVFFLCGLTIPTNYSNMLYISLIKQNPSCDSISALPTPSSAASCHSYSSWGHCLSLVSLHDLIVLFHYSLIVPWYPLGIGSKTLFIYQNLYVFRSIL